MKGLRVGVDIVEIERIAHALRRHGDHFIRRVFTEKEAEYCRSKRIPLLAEIPDDRRVAEAYSRGRMVCEAVPEMKAVFEALLSAIERCARR